MWELNHKEGRAPNNWWFQTVVLAKTLESPLDSKVIKPVNLKENQPWIFVGRTDAKAPILWPPDAKSWLIGKDLDAGKDWRQEEKGNMPANLENSAVAIGLEKVSFHSNPKERQCPLGLQAAAGWASSTAPRAGLSRESGRLHTRL